MKSQLLTQDATTGVVVATAATGVSGALKGITSIVNMNEAVTGYPKIVQLAAVAVVGNMIGVRAVSGKLGVALSSKLLYQF